MEYGVKLSVDREQMSMADLEQVSMVDLELKYSEGVGLMVEAELA